jgi:two-component system chemotaxis response regulator CheB
MDRLRKVVKTVVVRGVIVLGGSAGGVESLCTVVAGIPKKLSAALLAVIHTSEKSRHLAEVISRCGPVDVISTKRPAPLRAGKLYISVPGRHLVIRQGCAVSTMGPLENRHRPAVDTLFRSAARAYRGNVIAVVLSGGLDDGAAGALAVKARGGTVIVEDPAQAEAPNMPANVLRLAKADHCVPVIQIAPLLVKLLKNGHYNDLDESAPDDCHTEKKDSGFSEVDAPGLSCPECGGVLTQIQDGKFTRLRCHVGHTFSLESFSEAHSDALERALWIALRALNERRTIQQQLARCQKDKELRKHYVENAAAAEHDIKLLHEILTRL